MVCVLDLGRGMRRHPAPLKLWRTGAWKWLEKAIDMAGKRDIRMMALNDPDLERLWTDIAEI